MGFALNSVNAYIGNFGPPSSARQLQSQNARFLFIVVSVFPTAFELEFELAVSSPAVSYTELLTNIASEYSCWMRQVATYFLLGVTKAVTGSEVDELVPRRGFNSLIRTAVFVSLEPKMSSK